MADELSVTSSQPLPQQAPQSPGDLSVVSSVDQSPEAVAARHARSREGRVTINPGAPGGSTGEFGLDSNNPIEKGLEGAGKSALESTLGLAKMTGLYDVLPKDVRHLAEHTDLEPRGTAENVGAGVETGLEFAAGDEALKGATSFLKVAQRFPRVIALMDKYPKAAKILMSTLRGGAVGGAQGAVKESVPGGKGAAEGAKGGAAGGAAGAGLGESVVQSVKPVARILGLGGLSAEEAMTKAGRPYVGEINWKDSVERSLPTLVKLQDKFKNIGEFVDVLGDEQQNLWTKTIQPEIDKNATKIIDGTDVAKSIRAVKNPAWTAMPNTFKNETAAVESIAQDFDNFNFNLKDANGYLKTLNAKLSDFYKLDPVARRAAGVTDGELAGLEAAADGLRSKIYAAIDQTPGAVPGAHAEARQLYGSLKDLARVFGKRATVEERQAPMSLPMVIGLARAGEGALDMLNTDFGTGLKKIFGGAVPALTKAKQSSASLLKQGISAAEREAGGQPVRSAIKKGASNLVTKGAGAAGEAAGREALPAREEGFVRFRASDGSIHDVPQEHLDKAKEIDPQLEVLE